MKPVAIVHNRTIARLPDRFLLFTFFYIIFLNFVRRSCRVIHRKVSIMEKGSIWGTNNMNCTSKL